MNDKTSTNGDLTEDQQANGKPYDEHKTEFTRLKRCSKQHRGLVGRYAFGVLLTVSAAQLVTWAVGTTWDLRGLIVLGGVLISWGGAFVIADADRRYPFVSTAAEEKKLWNRVTVFGSSTAVVAVTAAGYLVAAVNPFESLGPVASWAVSLWYALYVGILLAFVLLATWPGWRGDRNAPVAKGGPQASPVSTPTGNALVKKR